MENTSNSKAVNLNRLGSFQTIQILACLLPLVLLLLSAVVMPRPYYVTEMDFEQDYYYNSRMIGDGIPLNYHHPGTPIYYLGHLLLYLSGTAPSKAQVFFNWGYIIVAVATAISLIIFSRILLKGLPASISALALVTIVVWPPFLTYSNYYGSDSFIVAAGLPTMTLFWKKLESYKKSIVLDILCGIGIGLCLSIKMTFFPLVMAIFISALIHGLRAIFIYNKPAHPKIFRNGFFLSVSSLAPLIFSTIISYLFFTAPIFNRLRFVWVRTFIRHDAYPPTWNLFTEIIESFKVMYHANPLYPIELIFIVSIFIYVVVCITRKENSFFKQKSFEIRNSKLIDTFDYCSGAIFLILMIVAFSYVSAAAVPITPGAEAGVRLRNISPSALFFPFLILYCYRYASECFPNRITRHSRYFPGIFMVAMLILLVGWINHFKIRNGIINDHLKRIADTRSRLEELASHGDRVAFWTESDQDMLGEVSFHFWGNYRYARNYYDNTLMQVYPSFAFLKLRNIRLEIVRERRKNSHESLSVASIGRSKYGVIGDLYWDLRRWLMSPPPDPEHWSIGGTVSGGEKFKNVSLVALPACELDEFSTLSDSEDESIELLKSHLGLTTSRKDVIGGIVWVLFKGVHFEGVANLKKIMK